MTGDSPSSPEYEDYNKSHSHRKKRVGKACDLCRIKKTKCDGKKPCNKCIADNKICVFTEKKKSKDRNHPQGYVELLETRIDLLLKLLEKLITVSTPHIPFLQELVKLEPDGVIPINKVVLYLINNEGLLKNLPVDWENGAMIAANLPSDKEGISKASKEFAEHLKNLESYSDAINSSVKLEQNNDLNSHVPMLHSSGSRTSLGPSPTNSSSSNLLHSKVRNGYARSNGDEYARPPTRTNLSDSLLARQQQQQQHQLMSQSSSNSNTNGNVHHQLNQQNYQPKRQSFSSIFDNKGGNSDFVNSSHLAIASIANANEIFSLPEFGSTNDQDLLPNLSIFDSMDDERPPPLFPKNNSVTSLTNKFEDHGIKLPVVNSYSNSLNSNSNGSTILRLLLISRAMLPQLKATGHVHKPAHVHSHSNISALHNSKNELRFSRINSNSLLLTPTPETCQTTNDSPSDYLPFSLSDNYTNSDALPLLAFMTPLYDNLGMLDTENNEEFITSNPFLRG